MKLWLLRPREEEKETGKWEKWYDKAFGFIVRAETEERAREMASKKAGDEGEKAWLNSYYSTCKELEVEGKEEIIVRDFRSG